MLYREIIAVCSEIHTKHIKETHVLGSTNFWVSNESERRSERANNFLLV